MDRVWYLVAALEGLDVGGHRRGGLRGRHLRERLQAQAVRLVLQLACAADESEAPQIATRHARVTVLLSKRGPVKPLPADQFVRSSQLALSKICAALADVGRWAPNGKEERTARGCGAH